MPEPEPIQPPPLQQPEPVQQPDAKTSRARSSLYLFLAGALLLGGIRLHRHDASKAVLPAAKRTALSLAPVPQLDGGYWALADHRGEVVLINYWATWCEPCRQEMPALAQLSREYRSRGLTIVGVSLDTGPDAPDRVRTFVDRVHVPYTVAFQPPDSTLDSGPAVLPTTLLIDRQGRLAKIVSGPVQPRDLADDMTTLLLEP